MMLKGTIRYVNDINNGIKSVIRNSKSGERITPTPGRRVARENNSLFFFTSDFIKASYIGISIFA